MSLLELVLILAKKIPNSEKVLEPACKGADGAKMGIVRTTSKNVLVRKY